MRLIATEIWGLPQQAKIDEHSPMKKQGLCQFFFVSVYALTMLSFIVFSSITIILFKMFF